MALVLQCGVRARVFYVFIATLNFNVNNKSYISSFGFVVHVDKERRRFQRRVRIINNSECGVNRVVYYDM